MASDADQSSFEFDFLCAALRPQPDIMAMQEILRRGVNFPALVELTEAHGVRPRLFQALALLKWAGVPQQVRAALEIFRERHLVRTLTHAQQHGRIADAFLAAGIGFTFFKGATLAADLYGDLSWREYGDIDVLVMPHQLAAAERALEGLGYLNRQGDRFFRATFLSAQRQYTFSNVEFGATVDLHWAFTARALPFPLRADEVWSSLKGVQVGPRRMPTVSYQNQALLLAGHGTKETWRSLAWVCDFAMLLERGPQLDWAALLTHARRNGSGNSLLLGCVVVEGLLGTPVPVDLVKPLQRNRRVRHLGVDLIRRLRAGPMTMRPQTDLMDLDLCDRRLDRLKAAVSVMLTPTPADYHACPLPADLWGAYYAIRPLRLAAQAVGLTRRRSLGDDPAVAMSGRSTPLPRTS
jgi:hypothetical protein